MRLIAANCLTSPLVRFDYARPRVDFKRTGAFKIMAALSRDRKKGVPCGFTPSDWGKGLNYRGTAPFAVEEIDYRRAPSTSPVVQAQVSSLKKLHQVFGVNIPSLVGEEGVEDQLANRIQRV